MRSAAIAHLSRLTLLLALTSLPGCGCESHAHSAGAGSQSSAPPEAGQFNGALYGACRMRPSSRLAEGQPRVYGHVLFRQDGPAAALQALFHLHGLPAASRQARALHVHQHGDLSEGCDSTGGHYDPRGVAHPGHPGDFGNVTPRRGRIRERRTAGGGATLFGGLSMLGRAVVLHEGEDDLGRGGDAGSRLHGNAGRRLACCVIGISSPKLWENTLQQQLRNPSG